MKKTIAFRVICIHPPAGAFGLQTKNKDIAAGTPLTAGRLRFAFELSVKPTDEGRPNFSGPYAHGSVQERFLYLTQKDQLVSGEWRIIKRIKVHLKTITWEQVDAVLADPGAFLEAAVDGRGAASVPLLGDGWTVQTSIT